MEEQIERVGGEDEVKIEYDPVLYPAVVWQPLKRVEVKVNSIIKQDAKDPSRGNQLKYIRKAYV